MTGQSNDCSLSISDILPCQRRYTVKFVTRLPLVSAFEHQAREVRKGIRRTARPACLSSKQSLTTKTQSSQKASVNPIGGAAPPHGDT